MATFKVEVKGFDIIACTQVQTVLFITHTKARIDADGNGSIKLSALTADAAMNAATKHLEGYKKESQTTWMTDF